MPPIKLIKKQHIWLPTPLGLIIITLVLLSSSIFTLKNLAYYLAQQQSIKSPILIVEGWISELALNEVIKHYKTEDYKIIITTGGMIKKRNRKKYKNYAELAAAYLRNNGLSNANIKILPTPGAVQHRTYLSAVTVRNWLQQQNIKTKQINLYSQGVHARRTKALYEMVFGEQYKIGINAAKTKEYKLDSWWKSSIGAKSVITEILGLTWMKCCFYPEEMPTLPRQIGHISIENECDFSL